MTTSTLFPVQSLNNKRAFDFSLASPSTQEYSEEESFNEYKKLKIDFSNELIYKKEEAKALPLYKRVKEMKKNRRNNFAKQGLEIKIENMCSPNSTDDSIRSCSDMLSVKSADQDNFLSSNRLANIDDFLAIEDNIINQNVPEIINQEVPSTPAINYALLQATIPKFVMNTKNRPQRPIKPVWNPENVNQQAFGDFLVNITKTINQNMINEEKSIMLLKKFEMNAEKVLKELSKDKAYYRNYFGGNQRQLRRKI